MTSLARQWMRKSAREGYPTTSIKRRFELIMSSWFALGDAVNRFRLWLRLQIVSPKCRDGLRAFVELLSSQGCPRRFILRSTAKALQGPVEHDSYFEVLNRLAAANPSLTIADWTGTTDSKDEIWNWVNALFRESHGRSVRLPGRRSLYDCSNVATSEPRHFGPTLSEHDFLAASAEFLSTRLSRLQSLDKSRLRFMGKLSAGLEEYRTFLQLLDENVAIVDPEALCDLWLLFREALKTTGTIAGINGFVSRYIPWKDYRFVLDHASSREDIFDIISYCIRLPGSDLY